MMDTDRGKMDTDECPGHRSVSIRLGSVSIISLVKMGYLLGCRERGRSRMDGSPQVHGRPGPTERALKVRALRACTSGQARSAVPASLAPGIRVNLCESVVPSVSAHPWRLGGERFGCGSATLCLGVGIFPRSRPHSPPSRALFFSTASIAAITSSLR